MNDTTTDPGLRSWIPVDPDSDFPVQNLPYGVFSPAGEPPRVGVAIGDAVLDLATLASSGFFADVLDDAGDLFSASNLNHFLARGRPVWTAVRQQLSRLLRDDDAGRLDWRSRAEDALVPRSNVTMRLPFAVGDFVDFYSSKQHAENVGRMFRPDSDPLLPNWRHLPVGYHGRSATVVVSGTPIRRPLGQRRPEAGKQPPFGPSVRLDFEMEVGFVVGPGNRLGEPIAAEDTADHIFGFVLVNDWSARDIQAWEYQPLGPFLGKSFATSISPWVVTLDALAPFRMPQPTQEPEPLPYLRTRENWAIDLALEVALQSASMDKPQTLSRPRFAEMYWTPAQQLAHATVNGTLTRPGDLYASGTVSTESPDGYGSMLELSWSGTKPIALDDGTERSFLEDGDTVIMRGWCGGGDRPRVGFGEVTGTIIPALDPEFARG